MSDRGAESPSPFSREGSRPSDGLGADQEPTGSSGSNASEQTWQIYPGSGATADPFTPPPAAPYAAAYGTNPYEVTPYQPGYGGYSPYGVVAIQHPRAVSAMVLGILGIVLAASCGIGGFLGIGGIVLGRKARNEIDAEPGRYAGRSQAVAGIVTGTIGTVLGVLISILIIVLVAVSAGLEGF